MLIGHMGARTEPFRSEITAQTLPVIDFPLVGNRCPSLEDSEPVGAELVIHGRDLRYRWTVTVGHDHRMWRFNCSI
jgi:hypothetical protein